MSDDCPGPSHTDPTWSHLFETSTMDTSSGDTPPRPEPVLPPVDPAEPWVYLPLPRELTNQETWDLTETLQWAGIPARAWQRGSLIKSLFKGKMNIFPEVPERFLIEARKVADQYFREHSAT
jgi:hypothetical protein